VKQRNAARAAHVRVAWWLASGLVVMMANGACRSQAGESRAPPIATPTLPEDPEAGARSVAEWEQHLEQEERERRLNYDRRKLSQHRALIKTLRAVRQKYDGATSKGAVLAAQQRQRALLPQLEKSLDAIDHWRVNSKVLPEYQELIGIFSDPYPSARIEALSGDSHPLSALQKEVATRFDAIDEWLDEAAESEDE
jgi:hypothetical protein